MNLKNKLSALFNNIDQKKITIAIVIAIIVIFIIGFVFGHNASISEYTANLTVQEKLLVDEEFLSAKDKLQEISQELSSQQELFNEFNDYKAKKEAKIAEITQLDSDITAKSTTIQYLSDEISKKSDELEQLKTGIVLTGQAPKTLPAGYFEVGIDIPEDRYSITGRSNFVVYSADGNLKVNTILGNSTYATESYVCFLKTGDIIKAQSACTYTPIK